MQLYSQAGGQQLGWMPIAQVANIALLHKGSFSKFQLHQPCRVLACRQEPSQPGSSQQNALRFRASLSGLILGELQWAMRMRSGMGG